MSLLDADSPLALELRRGRERFNAAVLIAQRQGLRVSPEALGTHLRDNVAPAVAAVAQAYPDRARAVTEALFELSLELVAKDVVGPAGRYPEGNEAWRSLLPRLAPALARDPHRLVGVLTNAVYNLSRERSVRVADWMTHLAELAPLCPSIEVLLDVGKVLAWQAGMAHWREPALATWETLPDGLACAIFGSNADPAASPRVLEELRGSLRACLADPWARPERRPETPTLRVVASVGGFRGFGGAFVSPPFVYASGAVLWARDAEGVYSLHADCYGETLRRSPLEPPEERTRDLCRLEANGQVSFCGLRARLPELVGASGFAAIPTLLAVTLTRSHRILLVARVGGGHG